MTTDHGRAGRAGTPWRAAIIWALLATAALMLASWARVLPSAPDQWTYDWRTYFLSDQPAEPRDDIAVVLIGEDTLAQYPTISPLDRGLLAALVRALDDAGARAIGLDVIFERETDPAQTDALLSAIRQARAQVVLGAIDADIPGVRPEQLAFQERFLQRAGRPVGHILVQREPTGLSISDGVVRYLPGGVSGMPSLAEQMARVAGWRGAREPSGFIAWQRPPARAGASLFPTFTVPPHAPGSPDAEILPESWRAAFQDRIVLIGGDLFDRDQHFTPFSVADGAKMPGVFIHAQAIAQWLDGRGLRGTPAVAEALAVFLLALLGFWLSWRWRIKRHDVLISVVGVGVLIVIGAMLFAVYDLVIPSASLFFGWLAGVWGGHYSPWVLRKLGAAERESEANR
jgi:CHASE2 domain-containing sensor protein